MSRPLPAWAEKIQPVDMDGAALLLGISRRTLVDRIRDGKHYERRGNRKVFYPEHIAALREVIDQCQGSDSSAAEAFGTPPAALPDSAYERALALATRRKPPSSARTTKRSSGNVIPMAKPLSEPSRRQP